jgi:hypothetical protein
MTATIETTEVKPEPVAVDHPSWCVAHDGRDCDMSHDVAYRHLDGSHAYPIRDDNGRLTETLTATATCDVQHFSESDHYTLHCDDASVGMRWHAAGEISLATKGMQDVTDTQVEITLTEHSGVRATAIFSEADLRILSGLIDRRLLGMGKPLMLPTGC